MECEFSNIRRAKRVRSLTVASTAGGWLAMPVFLNCKGYDLDYAQAKSIGAWWNSEAKKYEMLPAL